MEISEYKTHAMQTVKSYVKDLDYDVEIMEQGNPCVFFLREMGSHSTEFIPFEDFPPAGQRVKYLFGTADRLTILTNMRAELEHSIKEGQTNHIMYFDGFKVERIDLAKATALIDAYINDMKEQFAVNNGLKLQA